uniref:Uncharacterized protein n=1 Tax=Acrobeloides nanus TaxID=290746 RepID=A0A914DQP6_9BILA
MDRNIVLQLAVSLSIQKASTLSEIMRAWVQIATVLYQDIGNAFAFGSIMNALKSEL